jgi:hypothetical protein
MVHAEGCADDGGQKGSIRQEHVRYLCAKTVHNTLITYLS